jgi:L-malate glycosyltransferase
MRILEIVSARGINGVSKHVIDVAVELRNRGHEMTILGYPGAWTLEMAAQLGFQTIVSDMHRWPTDELRRGASFIHQNRIDVVHTHMSKANFFGVLLRWYAGVPSVATAHSCHLQLHWMANSFVVAVSEATRRYHRLVNLVPGSRIKTIHNSIQLPSAAHREQRQPIRNRVRSSLGLQAKDFAIGLVGRIAPQKGQLTMVEAMPAILASLPQARLLLIGGFETPDYLAQIQSQLIRHQLGDRVQMLGMRSDVLDLLYGIDLLAQPSLWESFPISMLEGMAAGVPIVASDVGGVRECIQHNRSGLLIPPKNPEDLSAAILKLAASPELCTRLANEAKKVVRLQFSPESQTSKLEAVLESVSRNRAHRSPTTRIAA